MEKFSQWIAATGLSLKHIVAYEFESASQLLEDFWKSVDYYMENN